MAIDIKPFFDEDTSTFTYIVSDRKTGNAAIIDSVLNYDQYSGKVTTHSADHVVSYIKEKNLTVEWILDTHIHADHITASHYLKEQCGGQIGIGSHIKEVLGFWVPLFNTFHDTPLDGSQFDVLLDDGARIMLGTVPITVMHTPGHTPACSSYLIEDAIFVGDTIFMPDLGTARTDFPGGSASTLFDSIQKLLAFDDHTRIFLCHDYPPNGRELRWMTTVLEQKTHNILVKSGTEKANYVAMRNKRDEGKAVPKLLLPSLQANLRAGTFGDYETNETQYVKIPINRL